MTVPSRFRLGLVQMRCAPDPAANLATAVDVAIAVWELLDKRTGRDPRVRVGIAVHRGSVSTAGGRVEPCALLRPETWGMPEPLEGVWASSAMVPVPGRLR